MAKEEKIAVIKIGGAQELVREGDSLKLNRIGGKEGSKVRLRDTLLVASGGKLKLGAPLVSGAEVVVEILEHGKGEKIGIRKFRAKSRYRRKTGHRQPITKVRVEKIEE